MERSARPAFPGPPESTAWTLSPARQRREEVAHFAAHLLRRGDGQGDLLPDELAIAPAQTMHGDFYGAFTHAQAGGQFRVHGCDARAPVNVRFSRANKAALPSR